jgi:FtsZ-binding cell division protein ZapB
MWLLQTCHDRKSKLKSTVSDLTHEAEALRRENEQLRYALALTVWDPW